MLDVGRLLPLIAPRHRPAFRRSLFRWYRKNGRDLPWRQTREPYAILVSELMLQQTQVATVIPYYDEWLRRFPDFVTLAKARESDVLHAWQGLGYYNRARNLHATAKLVQERHSGIFPRDVATMRTLPGVGRYTANAVASFVFDQSVPIVEANIARVIARLSNERLPIDSARGQKNIWNHAADLLPSRRSTEHNSALMDLGALICTSRKPKCEICPVKKFCGATNPERLPVKRPRPKMKRLIETHSLIVRQNRILLQQSSKRWRGMWILPPLKLDRFNRSSLRQRPIHTSVFPFTNHRITLEIFRQRAKVGNSSQRWIDIRSLDSIPIPSPHRRVLSALLN
jgi:A/G-specific adenine glycosylase